LKFKKWNELNKIRNKIKTEDEKKQPKFLFAGVIARHKGIHILVDLWNKYDFKGQLIICGVDLPSGGSAEIIENINKNDNIIWKGRLNKEELEKEYLSSTAFLFPSFVEGLPNVMLESMSLGLPCIANKIKGVTDFLLENNRGVLVDDNDNNVWKTIIEELIFFNDITEKRNKEISLNAHNWVSTNADSKIICAKIENIYLDFWKN